MIKKNILIISIIIFSLLLVGCSQSATATISTEPTPTPPITYDLKEIAEGFELGEPDKTFITGEPCEAPCYHGIELLITTGEETASILETLDFVDKESIYTIDNIYKEGSFFIYYHCGDENAENCGYVGVSSYDLVTSIGSKIFYRLSLGEVVEKFGKPSFSYKNAMYRGENVCQIVVYYVDNNFAIEIIEDGDKGVCEDFSTTGKLAPELQIDWVYYNFIDEEIADNMIKWQGLK